MSLLIITSAVVVSSGGSSIVCEIGLDMTLTGLFPYRTILHVLAVDCSVYIALNLLFFEKGRVLQQSTVLKS